MRTFILLAIVLLSSCSTKKVSTRQIDYSKIVSMWKEMASSYEKRTEVYRDSLMMMKGLVEKSSNVSDSVSHLETSYASSDAAIRNGRLHHSIENKDSIPGNTKYIYVNVETKDTIMTERRDTVLVEKKLVKETVKEKKRFFDSFFYTSGWIAWALFLVGSGIWFRYKVKKGER